jgi:hypothetical protein
MTEELQNKLDSIKNIKEHLTNDILNDLTLSNLEKLQLIKEHNLFKVEPFILHVFEKYLPEYQQQIIDSGTFDFSKRSVDNLTFDDWFFERGTERHEMVDFVEIIEMFNDPVFPTDPEELVTVLVNRTTDHTFDITGEQFLQDIYDFAVENKVIGFTYDW